MITLTRGTHVIRTPIGFSVTSFFFGFFPALFRADWKAAFVTLGVSLLGFIPGVILFTLPYFIIYTCVYNRMFIAKKMLVEGYNMDSRDAGLHPDQAFDQLDIFPLSPSEKNNVIRYGTIMGVLVVLVILAAIGAA